MRWCFSIACLCFMIQIGYCQCEDKCYGSKKFESTSKDIAIDKLWESSFNVSLLHTPLAYDVDNDGETELILQQNTDYFNPIDLAHQLIILKPRSKSILKVIEVPYFTNKNAQPITIADINNDCNPEIIIATMNTTLNPQSIRKRLVCLDLDGNILWISNEQYGENYTENFETGTLGLADFNRDGNSEVYILNEIYNAQTGVKLCQGGKNGLGLGNYHSVDFRTSISVVGNVDENPNDLELIAGYSVYKVIISNLSGESGNTMIPINLEVDGKLIDGTVSLADFTGDGILEIVLDTKWYFPNSGIYIFKIRNNKSILLVNDILNNSYFTRSGAVTIGNFPWYPRPFLFCIFENKVIALEIDSNFEFLIVQDLDILEGSGKMGTTIFNLNADNQFELILRDENSLFIYSFDNSFSIVNKIQYPCKSSTLTEMPIVTALEKNGEARICVTCMDQNNNGRLTIFGPPSGQHWAPARNIWHQYAYNPLFINDDGTVPQYMQNPATYKNGKYNNFMVQESLIDEDGNYPVAAASLFGDITCIDYDPVMKEYTVTFGVENRADASKTAGSNLPVSFYSGDPQAGGTLLTAYHTDVDLQAGERIERTVTIPETAMTSIWMIVNTDKYPIVVSDTSYYDIDECDYTDNVFIAPAPKIINTSQEICQGDSYDFYGNALTVAGQYAHEISNAQACDSIVTILDLRVTTTKTAQQNISTCDRYDWNGTTYTQSGQYTYKTKSANGCDSIVTLDLTIFPTSSSEIVETSCNCYAWNGQTYKESGRYEVRAKNVYGCDSISTLDLKIVQPTTSDVWVEACDFYYWPGDPWQHTYSGKYTQTITNQVGCDSVMTLHLTIHKSDVDTFYYEACDIFWFYGVPVTSDIVLHKESTNIFGCDSIAHHVITIHHSSQATETMAACDSYVWHGTTYDTSGQYTYQSQTIFGCDSITTLDLTIHPNYDIKESMAACDSITWQGTTYKQSGIYTITNKTAAGCDSIRTLDLTVYYRSSSDDSQEACTIYLWNGTEYTSSGTYTYITKNQAGCDSLATLTLDIYPEFHQGDTIETDKDYLWPIDGRTYTESGQYLASFTTEQGCDSIYTLLLRINREISIVFPTIFNPSGTANSIFFGSSKRSDITLTHFSIYDRWGNVVFATKHAQLNDPSDGWDGRYRGQWCAQGVYVWVAEIRYDDGRTETLHGDVTVVR